MAAGGRGINFFYVEAFTNIHHFIFYFYSLSFFLSLDKHTIPSKLCKCALNFEFLKT